MLFRNKQLLLSGIYYRILMVISHCMKKQVVLILMQKRVNIYLPM